MYCEKCFLCNKYISVDNKNKQLLNKLLKLSCFKNFNKQTQLYYVCDNCCCNNYFVDINEHLNDFKTIPSINIFVAQCEIYTSLKTIKTIKKTSTIYKKKEQRKQELNEKIKSLKLTYVKSICDPYVKFGKDSIDCTIKKLQLYHTKKNDRLYDLLSELQKTNMSYDSKIPSFQKFIKSGGDLDKTIKNAMLEKALIENTDYLSLLQNNIDVDTAIDISIGHVPENVNNDAINNYIKKKNKLVFL